MIAEKVELMVSAVTNCALTAVSLTVSLCTVVVIVYTVVLSAAAAIAKFAIAFAISSSCDTLLAGAKMPCLTAAFSLSS